MQFKRLHLHCSQLAIIYLHTKSPGGFIFTAGYRCMLPRQILFFFSFFFWREFCKRHEWQQCPYSRESAPRPAEPAAVTILPLTIAAQSLDGLMLLFRGLLPLPKCLLERQTACPRVIVSPAVCCCCHTCLAPGGTLVSAFSALPASRYSLTGQLHSRSRFIYQSNTYLTWPGLQTSSPSPFCHLQPPSKQNGGQRNILQRPPPGHPG